MKRLYCLALGLALAGCINLAPRYQRPPAPVPGTVANSAGTLSAATPPASWQAFFADPRLRALIARALADNRDLRAAVANIEIARGAFVAQRAQIFPSINATAGATFAQLPAAAASRVGGGSSGGFYERTYGLSAGVSGWELDLFGRLRNLSAAAQEQFFASQEAQREAEITLIGQVAQAWLTVGADRSLLAAAQASLASGEASLSLTKARFNGGIASAADVDQAATIVDQARSDVGRYTAQAGVDRDALELLVGAPVADSELPADVGEGSAVLQTLPTGVASSVLLQRPDVLQAEDQLRAAYADIGAARAAFFPQITLTGSGGFESTALSRLFQGASRTWSFAPQIVQPIFDFGRNRGGLVQASGQRDLAQANYEKAIQTAFREVADALAQQRQLGGEVGAQEALVAASADALKIAEARYRSGADTYLNVLIAERTLYGAEQTLASTRLSAETNIVTLYSALGGGLG
ncbi:MAG TPA: efflux transporter outer membrane subunit [Caulobacteraceae bacterium]|nr:efflux transporter outer membrane subunit [Caulobacteraceae bacterium]